jgi:hypothetical protein
MKAWMLLCGALFTCAGAFARPLVLEPNDKPALYATAIAHTRNEFIALESRQVDPNDPDVFVWSANLYRRQIGGIWTLQQVLLSETGTFFGTATAASMSATTAAVRMPSGLHIFERTATGWIEAPFDGAVRPQGFRVVVERTNILTTQEADCASEAISLSRLANGHFAVTGQLTVPAGGCVDGFDLDRSFAIVRSTFAVPGEPDRAQIFGRIGIAPGWSLAATFDSPESDTGLFGPEVAIRGLLALVSGSDLGAHVYYLGANGWQPQGLLVTPDSYEYPGQYSRSLQISGDYVVQVGWNINRRTDVAYLYRVRDGFHFDHLAVLATDEANGISHARFAADRIVALQQGRPLVYNMPASFEVPALVQDDFQSGAAASWTALPGSQFSIASNGTTQVYRQASLAGDAGAVHATSLANQSVSADIKPTAFNGSDRWFGLMTRYTDDANYYFVTVRSSGIIALKKQYRGTVSTLASLPLDVAAGQHYRITLESSGTHHGVYVDGVLIMQRYDAQLRRGRPGLRTFRTAADFDNVVVTPGPHASLAYTQQVFSGGNFSGTYTEIFQSLIEGNARMVSGHPREDQAVQSMITVDAFAPTGSPWVGLIARYVDANNYYYVTARKANRLSLRRLTNGAVSELGSVSFPVAAGAPFVLRLEAIGDRLRVYVNDELKLERAGAQVVAGKVGVMTYRASALFDAYTAYEP